jgi:hypothetical protein
MGLEFIIGLTAVNSKEAGKKTKSQALVLTVGKMAEDMKDIGIKIICMDKVNIIGQMVGLMKAHI